MALLSSLFKDVFAKPSPGLPVAAPVPFRGPVAGNSVLNVGGGHKGISIPVYYDGWNHLLLDVDPNEGVDIVLDARALTSLGPALFDAIYCSHNLEHYHKHDVPKVLAGFHKVLKPEGFADIRVPDMRSVLNHVVQYGLDIDDTLYTGDAGPISVHDVIYGWGQQIETSGQDFYAHKRGFTRQSLVRELELAGFQTVFFREDDGRFELQAMAFKTTPSMAQRQKFALPNA